MKKTIAIFTVLFALIIAPLQSSASDIDPVTNADRAYFISVREAIMKNDKKWLADQMSLPMECYVKGKKTTIESKEQFIQQYNEIINEYVRASAREQNEDDLFKNSQGFMVGKGAIWMVQTYDDEQNSKYYIYKINNKPRK